THPGRTMESPARRCVARLPAQIPHRRISSLIVELHGVDLVSLGVIHPGRDKGVVEPIAVQVADAGSPGAVALSSDRIGHLAVLGRTVLHEKRVAPDAGTAVATKIHVPL